MYEFVSHSFYRIKGKGLAFAVRNHEECPRDALNKYLGPIMLDGVQRECIGVESHCVPVIAKGAWISILIKEPL